MHNNKFSFCFCALRIDLNGALYDDIRIDTKTKEVVINPTNDKQDRIFIDGRYLGVRAKGTSESLLTAKGFNVSQGLRIEGAGMGPTNKGLAFVGGVSLIRSIFELSSSKELSNKSINDPTGYERQTDSRLNRSKNSYEELIKEHQQKIEDFKSDPEGQSDPKLLKQVKENAPEKVKKNFSK